MGDFYVWDPARLSVAVQAMDDEHIILIDKMNKLYKANAEKKPASMLSSLLNDFANYTVKHFTDEEAYMERIGYNGLATHKLVHKNLLDQVNQHVQVFNNTGALTEEFFKFLSIWLTSHIRGIDVKYYKERNVG